MPRKPATVPKLTQRFDILYALNYGGTSIKRLSTARSKTPVYVLSRVFGTITQEQLDSLLQQGLVQLNQEGAYELTHKGYEASLPAQIA